MKKIALIALGIFALLVIITLIANPKMASEKFSEGQNRARETLQK